MNLAKYIPVVKKKLWFGLSSPSVGDIAYDTSTESLYIYNGSSWVRVKTEA